LTAAGLAGPLASGALGATTTTPVPSEGASAPTTEAGTPETETQTSTTTTSTTTTPESPSAASTTPAPSAPSTTNPPVATPPAPVTPPAPAVVLRRKQKATPSVPSSQSQTTTEQTSTSGASTKPKSRKPAKKAKKASGPNHVAPSPQSVAVQTGALLAMLANAEASDQALSFYRIPLFLLPIYKAAAVQYGVPWQILAAINEIETDYGSDLSVSTAGAVGWMQFMPSTWLQYGVDALNAGYADPYNPVDAIFAAARYLRAAGAATNLRAAILAYNHSDEYVESVLLRAKLISTYPKAVIATLTGLIDGRLPVTGKQIAWTPLPKAPTPTPSSSSSATAGATALPSSPAPSGTGTATATGAEAGASASAGAPGSSAAVSPTAAAAAASAPAAAGKAPHPLQLVELLSSPNASVVAVQDGRVVQIGDSRKLGKYVVLRDVYGDVFTYAGLGSIAPTYVLAKAHKTSVKSQVVEAASTRDPAPSQPATAGVQAPVTLTVKTPSTPNPSGSDSVSVQANAAEPTPPGMDKVRLFAHPHNADARAAVAASAARRARRDSAGQNLPLRAGAVVASGTVLGRVSVPSGARDGHLRFAIRPSGDTETINPGPVLANWAQLQSALHPQGAKASDALLGATASDVFLLSKPQLERAVLAEPGITLDACARHEVAAGVVDKRVLALLAFLSRSGLEPTVGGLRCASREFAVAGASSASYSGDELDISAINGTPIAGHQGPESITELTIRTLLTLPSEFVPHSIVSLMRFPGLPSTQASSADWNRIHLEFRAAPAAAALSPAAAATVAHSAHSGRTAPAPSVSTSPLSAAQWSQLMDRVGALPMPSIPRKPSSAAVPDPKR
jgi:soluble lytic murein transglycosylase-like protein